jgi:hypothetical protein
LKFTAVKEVQCQIKRNQSRRDTTLLLPYLIVDGGVAALDFYKKAFGAKEMFRFPMPNGKLGHAEIKIGDSHVMLADEPEGPMADNPDHQVFKSPKASAEPVSGFASMWKMWTP